MLLSGINLLDGIGNSSFTILYKLREQKAKLKKINTTKAVSIIGYGNALHTFLALDLYMMDT